MDRMTVYATGVAVVLYAGVTYLRTTAPDSAIIPFFISGIVVGLVAASVKWGFIVSFAVSFVFSMALALATVSISDPNVLAAFTFITAVASLIVGGLGAAAGLGGRRLFHRKKQTPVTPAPQI